MEREPSINSYDVAVVGAGVAGLTAAALLQKDGARTILLEAHDKAGGCAGYFFHKGYNLDVGATVLMGLDPAGLHTYVYEQLGVDPPRTTLIDTVRVHLPDRTIDIAYDEATWRRERVGKFAGSPDEARRLTAFWAEVDRTADILWTMTGKMPVLPLRGFRDVLANLRLASLDSISLAPLLLARFDHFLKKYGLAANRPLRAFLDGLLLITTQETADVAPALNGAAGVDIYRHGIRRARGGMKTFIKSHVNAYRALGGTLRLRQRVVRITALPDGRHRLTTDRGLTVEADRVVCNLPVWNLEKLVVTRDRAGRETPPANRKLTGSLKNAGTGWGAFTVYLGVDASVIPPDTPLNHQVLDEYGSPFKDGNSCFLSLCEPEDTLSAPPGRRTLNVSTHTEVETWYGLSREAYEARKAALTERALAAVRTVFPDIDRGIEFVLPGTPVTFERYTGRERGMVGGIRTRVFNSNLFANGPDVGLDNFWLVGDTVFPGQGTMACALSGINAWRDIRRELRRETAEDAADVSTLLPSRR